jgi:hypothetical protein
MGVDLRYTFGGINSKKMSQLYLYSDSKYDDSISIIVLVIHQKIKTHIALNSISR